MGKRGTDVGDSEATDEELAQLEHARDEQLDLGLEHAVTLDERRIELAHRAHAGGGRRHHNLRIGEHAHETASQLSRLAAVARIEMHLTAARLRLREANLVPEALQQPDGTDARLGNERVRQTGNEERDPHRAAIIARDPSSDRPSD